MDKIKIATYKINKFIQQVPPIGLISLLLAILTLLVYLICGRTKKEGFKQQTEFILKKGPHVYDNFYTSIYDLLVFDELKNNYEIGEIVNKTSPNSYSIILDINSKLGHHTAKLTSLGGKVIGVDDNLSMIKQAKQNYPSCYFKHGDVLQPLLFTPNSFTHILALDFALYHIKDKRQFLQNCYNWLMPGGYISIHLVNRQQFNKFNSINTTISKNNQKQLKAELKTSAFNYNAIMDFEEEKQPILKEIFNFKEGSTRVNETKLYMENQKDILAMARNCGFIDTAEFDLLPAGYKNQYVYILQKPE